MEAQRIKEIALAVNGILLAGDENAIVTSVVTNSKEVVEGTLFVPIIGERVDAHRFIESAFLLGAVATFTSKSLEEIDYVEGKAYIYVEDTLQALQQFAAYYRSQFDIPVIGVTGSVGKTTTKEMIAAALETKYSVLKTAGNMNSQVGLPLTVFGIDRSHQIAVIEMGMSEEGELPKLAKIAKPSVAVVTNIGVSHIAQLGSRENIRREKLSIINENSSNCFGTLYVNGNDDLLCGLIPYQSDVQNGIVNDQIVLNEETKKALAFTKICAYGTESEANYYAKDIATKDGMTTFTCVFEDNSEERITLKVLGEHNVMNAIVALAIAKQMGIAPNESKQGLFGYEPIAMRGKMIKKNGITVIDDSYNASPDSMKSGIQVLLAVEGANRRIAVLADVLELGDASKECHESVGHYIVALEKEGKVVDEVVVVGDEARHIAEVILATSTSVDVTICNSNREAVAYLKSKVKEQDVLLVKGSRGMHTDEIVTALTE